MARQQDLTDSHGSRLAALQRVIYYSRRMTEEAKHRNEVKERIRFAMSAGASEYQDILSLCEGADPRLVAECIAEIGAVVTRSTTALPLRETLPQVPAADPFRSQWWFSGETVEFFFDRIATRTRVGGGRVLCLGAPTVGHLLLARGIDTLVLDVDKDVVAMIHDVFGDRAREFDAADELPHDLLSTFTATVIDPPWYDVAAHVFLRRAIDACMPNGEVLMSLPPRLTRPGTDRFRSELIDSLLKAGHELLSLESQKVGYLVPRFEEAALGGDFGFRGIPWRRADLLHVRKREGATTIPAPPLERVVVSVFARNPPEFRVFLREKQSADPSILLERLPLYSKNISTRASAGEDPDIWTSEKVGVRTGNRSLIEKALVVWGDKSVRTREDAIARLKPEYPALAERIVEELDRELSLWSRFATQPPLRTDREIADAKRKSLTEWATSASPREHKHDDDRYRDGYQRDRDRILWAGSLRTLGHKTQLFPSEHDDQTRQRLTHSIEVMQLASTIGASFGLDRDLIEAGALAHDIGHTPFGHAGEHALHGLFEQIHPQLHGFNHYEHGVDVIRWLEGPYYASNVTAFHGLNLTPEVAECVLKHTFCHSGMTPSSEQLLREGKHGDLIPKGYCHLEG